MGATTTAGKDQSPPLGEVPHSGDGGERAGPAKFSENPNGIPSHSPGFPTLGTDSGGIANPVRVTSHSVSDFKKPEAEPASEP